NSLLILAKLLSDNPERNLSDKQVEYDKTIYASGGDLLTLINEILDLSKVEAGKMTVEPREVALADISDFVDRSFRPLAEQKDLAFKTDVDVALPMAVHTDPQRLQQVLKNLLANALKFTSRGSVTLRIHRAKPETRFAHEALRSGAVVAFSVADTGIGIARDKQQLIFEPFLQADGTTSPKYRCSRPRPRAGGRAARAGPPSSGRAPPACSGAKSISRARSARAACSRCTCP